MTAHSLEPARPWKAEQLGGGYRVSSWAERTAFEDADAVIAVSDGMRRDVLATYPRVDPARVHVVRNGIDTQTYRRVEDTDALVRYGVDPDRPYVVFVGRITRQKGLAHLVRAAAAFDTDAQVVLCAGAPDTAELAEEIRAGVADLQAMRDGVVWITRDAGPRRRGATAVRTPRSSAARRSTSRWESSTSRPWPAKSRSWPAGSAGSPRWSRTGSPGCWSMCGESGGGGFETGLAEAVNTVLRGPRAGPADGAGGPGAGRR